MLVSLSVKEFRLRIQEHRPITGAKAPKIRNENSGKGRQQEATRCSGATRSGLEKEGTRESQNRKPEGIIENQIEPEKRPDWYKARWRAPQHKADKRPGIKWRIKKLHNSTT